MRMGPYELLERIGVGGMGAVYRARHHETGDVVAVKVMEESLASDPVLLRRFEQEYTAARRLAHPHLVRSIDFGMEGNRPYLVMELVDGPSLGERVRRDGPLPVEEAVRIVCQVAEALQAAHDRRLVHRDVKPDNVLLGSDGRARLPDLGLIKDLDARDILTRPRAWLGTVGYTAPEQFGEAGFVDARADIYALAGTLYFALTGMPPFPGRGGLSIMRKKLANDFPTARSLIPMLPASLDELISRSLNASPDRRPRSCREFARTLAQAIASGSSATGRVSDHPERREAVRHTSSLAIYCRVSSAPDDCGAEVQDVSWRGICVQLRCSASPGDLLTLELPGTSGDSRVLLRARVRWARGAPGGRRRLGCEFETELTPGELKALIGMQTPTVVVADSEQAVLPTEAPIP